jgi:hypothetical protein
MVFSTAPFFASPRPFLWLFSFHGIFELAVFQAVFSLFSRPLQGCPFMVFWPDGGEGGYAGL